mmetsp:Transcript_27293/g.26104  ORF Transcript_27293/g.26104 Transcript_27293/m.26104 type:complete len:308 (+) Transcript_27293:52-975(+)
MVLAERNIYSAQEANDVSFRNTAIELQLLSQRADQIFHEISLLASSVYIRINDLSNRIGNKQSSHLKNCRNDTNHSNQLLLPASRPERLRILYNAAKMNKVPSFDRMDHFLIDNGQNQQEIGECSREFSDPALFFDKWRSQQESRLTELQAERSSRRLEKKERKLLEMKKTKELSQKRRITEQIPKSIQWKDGVPINRNQIEMAEGAGMIEPESNLDDKNNNLIIENIETIVNESISYKLHRNSVRIIDDNSVLRQRPVSGVYGGSMRNSGRRALSYIVHIDALMASILIQLIRVNQFQLVRGRNTI